MIPYQDLSNLPEDSRIKHICEFVLKMGLRAAITTDDIPGKAERHVRKIKKKYNGIKIIEIIDGPVKGTRTIIIEKDNNG